MIRTQVQLTEEQARRLKELASSRGVSMAALIRAAVDQYVSTGSDLEARWERALSVLGRYRDKEGATDVAVEHDRYLDEAFDH